MIWNINAVLLSEGLKEVMGDTNTQWEAIIDITFNEIVYVGFYLWGVCLFFLTLYENIFVLAFLLSFYHQKAIYNSFDFLFYYKQFLVIFSFYYFSSLAKNAFILFC